MNMILSFLCPSLLALFLIVFPVVAGEPAPTQQKIRLCISQFASHPALDATYEGIKKTLEDAGFIADKTLDLWYASAQSTPALAQQIADKCLAFEPDLILALGTGSAQSFIKPVKSDKAQVVFTSVTDPVAAHLVQDVESPEKNITGVSNFLDPKAQLTFFLKLLPHLKKIGVLYNKGEINSDSLVKRLEALCPSFGLALVQQTVTKTVDVPQATQSLLGQVDAIFVSQDNTVLSAISTVIRLATKAGKPVLVSDTDLVAKGAFAALGPNQYQLGVQTGQMVLRILGGQSISAQKIEFPEIQETHVNLGVAKKIGKTIPEDFLTTVTRVYP